MSTLYELQGQYMELLDLIEQGELDPDMLRDTLEGLDGEIEDKADGYGKVIKELEGKSAMLTAEIDRLAARKVTLDNSIKTMKDNLKQAMIITGKTKIKTDLFNFTVAKNGGKQPIHIVDDAVPIEFCKTILKPDSELIRKMLENGEELSFARLEERGESLRIK